MRFLKNLSILNTHQNCGQKPKYIYSASHDCQLRKLSLVYLTMNKTKRRYYSHFYSCYKYNVLAKYALVICKCLLFGLTVDTVYGLIILLLLVSYPCSFLLNKIRFGLLDPGFENESIICKPNSIVC